ncbi:MAG: RluA family pseudouridine synthase [Polaromonas sp.]|nr:RluA family pseudouridine synthase [Polaromonas sp.]
MTADAPCSWSLSFCQPATLPDAAALTIVPVGESLLVLDKPAGLLAVPGRGEDKQDCLSRRAQALFPDALIVHRLDMATSGLMLMARDAAMQRALSKLFEQREVHKRYTAVVEGQLVNPDPLNGWQHIDLAIAADWPRRPLRIIDASGKPSQTRWRVMGFDAHTHTSRVELEPVTGRSHQLRVHLQAIGHPIVGDALYAPEAVQRKAGRLLLHAGALGFAHPLTGEALGFQSEPGF